MHDVLKSWKVAIESGHEGSSNKSLRERFIPTTAHAALVLAIPKSTHSRDLRGFVSFRARTLLPKLDFLL